MRSLRAYIVAHARGYCYINYVIRCVDNQDIGGMYEMIISVSSYVDVVNVHARNRILYEMICDERYIRYYLHDEKLEWHNGKMALASAYV